VASGNETGRERDSKQEISIHTNQQIGGGMRRKGTNEAGTLYFNIPRAHCPVPWATQ
jgi:hypothetical protein